MSLQFAHYTYIIPLFITAAITLVLLLIGIRRRHSPAARIFVLFCSTVLIWSVGYAFEFMAIDLEAKLFWARVQYLGLISPVAFLLFTQLYLGVEERVYWQNFIVLMLMPLIANVAAWTNDQHKMLWTYWGLDPTGNSPGLQLEHGVIFYAIVAYSYLLLLSGVYYIVLAFRSSSYVRRRQAGILLAAVAAPWLGNLLYILDLTPNGLDLTPINFGISGIFLAIGLVRYYFLDVTPIARNRVIEKLQDSVIVIDNQGRVVDVNPAAIQLLKCNRRDVIAQPVQNLLHELPVVVSALNTQSSVDLTARLINEDEAKIFNASISVLKNKQDLVQGRVVMLHDITQQEHDAEALRESEARLRTLVQQLKELDELKTRFMRNVNHELRTPLTNITLYIDLLRTGNPENFPRYLSVLEKETATLRRLIEQTLNLERVDDTVAPPPVNLRTTNLKKLIESVSSWAEKLAVRSEISFTYNVDAEPIHVKADSDVLKSVLSNLLTNAFTYTPHGGHVFLSLQRNDQHAIIQIKDDGLGISDVDKKRIFEPFYRGDQAASGNIPGLGLGLSTAKVNVEQHSGWIEVESKLGHGSVFTVYLPLLATNHAI